MLGLQQGLTAYSLKKIRRYPKCRSEELKQLRCFTYEKYKFVSLSVKSASNGMISSDHVNQALEPDIFKKYRSPVRRIYSDQISGFSLLDCQARSGEYSILRYERITSVNGSCSSKIPFLDKVLLQISQSTLSSFRILTSL